MKILDFAKSRWKLASRLIVLAFACTFIFLFNAFPALAISSYQSEPTEGTTQLLETQRKTDEAAKKPPIGMKESQEKTRRGLNEVQGAADIEKMKRPENTESGTTSVEQEVESFLEKITGSKQ
ncbi:hypothetical protein PN497_17395 [Sphaerospermopsis kisseleviana CS-549]|jgi:hypothetical protein|uniref:Low temperature-induced protein n=1 Tax=Sphaerospermopsis kisseleviana CS-549 TaxID=3021783 RepID=A0ABT4ZWJ4_9CYAN|nr:MULTISPECIES: hypothetical protein [Sphaerospermopsis]MBD2147803.1 hypothetical protein [Sphaerospermopsis sp. FACHB-1194]MDB9443123.1 hypothetical protein [Sphaerospermopsis kisseleviana CS-549]BAZ80854.1 low temperature-induced protein [Sphaerospermopsis kisseleviana NIES-73]